MTDDFCEILQEDFCYFIATRDYKTARALLDIAITFNCVIETDGCDDSWLKS